MMNIVAKPVSIGTAFAVAMLVSCAATAVIAVVLWASVNAAPRRTASLVILWVFTVLQPAVTAIRIHRAVNALSAGGTDPADRSLQALAQTRPVLLLSGTMALLSALTLIYGQ
jgi:hypothetical protein